MNMKRRGVIRAIAALAAAYYRPRPVKAQTSSGLVSVSHHSSFQLALADEKDEEAYGLVSISITYKGETVVLTAHEIFEALKS